MSRWSQHAVKCNLARDNRSAEPNKPLQQDAISTVKALADKQLVSCTLIRSHSTDARLGASGANLQDRRFCVTKTDSWNANTGASNRKQRSDVLQLPSPQRYARTHSYANWPQRLSDIPQTPSHAQNLVTVHLLLSGCQ